ncbi:MAG: ISAs1 family transposase, partial [Parachlamydiaceae bacterium]
MANDPNKDLDKNYPIIEFIKQIPDPRAQSFHFQHPLVSIIFIVLVTGLCGANDWISVVEIARSMEKWIAQYVPLPYGIPSHDTFGRVFSMICPKEFNKFLINWSSLLREKKDGQEVVSFDGKTLCGTAERALGLKGLHILNAWSQDNGICIGQFKVDDKSNEITAIPQLIKLLDLENCIVTCDALNTQKNNAKAVIDA